MKAPVKSFGIITNIVILVVFGLVIAAAVVAIIGMIGMLCNADFYEIIQHPTTITVGVLTSLYVLIDTWDK
jgi:hypothetical protein